MQSATLALAKLGGLPSCEDVHDDWLAKFQSYLSEIEQPVSNEDAAELAKLLGPDDCFGMAWTLVHAIETVPGWPLEEAISEANDAWKDVLRDRCKG